VSGAREARSPDAARGLVRISAAPGASRRLRGLSDDAWGRLGGAVSVEPAPDRPRFRGILRRAAPLVAFAACLAVLGSELRVVPTQTDESEESRMRSAAVLTLAVCISNAEAATAVVGWGRNDFGQATMPGGLTSPTAISAGLYHSLAIRSDGSVVAWGWNSQGQSDVSSLSGRFVAAEAGYQHSVLLSSSGSIVCIGDDSHGQCAVPPKLPFARAIGVGDDFTLAVLADGSVRAWGRNSSGQLDVPSGLSGVMACTGGAEFALALGVHGAVTAWGRNDFGQCAVPANVGVVVDVVAGAWHGIALRADRSVACWGRNEYGQLNTPTDLGPVVAIAGDRCNVTMVLLEDGSVRHWGQWNEVWTNPTPPSGVTRWRAIACGGYHAIGIPDSPACPGDVNGDGVSDGADLSILLSSWGACP
jgi:alpha-tubulin suppressor-like RCC1 family protein